MKNSVAWHHGAILRTRFFFLVVALGLAVTPVRAQDIRADSLKAQLLDVAALLPFAADQVEGLANLIALEASTAPLGTSSGGFTFVYDSQLKLFTRTSPSFGPLFAERSLTIGKGKVSAGVNWLNATYDSLAGQDLDNLVVARNIRLAGVPFSQVTSALDVSSSTVVGYLSYGAASNLDLSLSIPWIRIGLGATVTAFLPSGAVLLTSSVPDLSASGLGDIGVIAKYRFLERGTSGFAGGLEVRFPTGDTDDLRGLGVTRVLASGIWSATGRISPHVNVGYEFWSDHVASSIVEGVRVPGPKDVVKYAAGAEMAPHPRLTVMLDLVGRYFPGAGTSEFATLSDGNGGSLEALVGTAQGFGTVSLAPGFRWNIYGSGLVTSSVLFSLHNNELRANVVPVLGVDWAF